MTKNLYHILLIMKNVQMLMSTIDMQILCFCHIEKYEQQASKCKQSCVIR